MTAVSKTITITNTTYETIESLASITMTASKTYSIQIQNMAYVKIADAEFVFNNEKFTLTQGSDAVYIKTNGIGAVLTILENV